MTLWYGHEVAAVGTYVVLWKARLQWIKKKKKKNLKGRGISAAKSQEDAWKLTRLEMKKRQKQEGLLKLELTWASLVHQSMWISTLAQPFSPSVLPMEQNAQDSAQLWYPTVPPFHRGASHCNPFLMTETKWSLMWTRTFLHVKLSALNHPTGALDTAPAVGANKAVCSAVQFLFPSHSPVRLFATHELGPGGLLCLWNFPAKNTEAGRQFPHQGIFQPWDWICISCASCTGKQILYHHATCEAPFPSWELLKSSEPW